VLAAGGTDVAKLTVERILDWADWYHRAKGHWPRSDSGPVAGVPGVSWGAVNAALVFGRPGLPGATNLSRLLVQHRGPEAGGLPPDLTVEQILGWANAYHAANGRWPNPGSGPVAGAPEYTWRDIDTILSEGGRGLPGGTTLRRLVVPDRSPKVRRRPRELTVALILSWADAFHEACGRWPNRCSGRVASTPAENWSNITNRLREGGRSLPGGSSLSRLLNEHRGVPDPRRRPALCPDQIVAWADAHHAATGKWPSLKCGTVTDAPGETWSAIDESLRRGARGLPGGSSLARLLNEHRPARKVLTLEMIRAWGAAHHAATGRWANTLSGAVAGAPGMTWLNISMALRKGCRGLPRGTRLGSVFQSASYTPRHYNCRPLSLDQVLAWADAHHAATGRWPQIWSGAIAGAPGEKWVNINQALGKGLRGLPSKTSLAKLLAGREVPAVAGQPSSHRSYSG